VATREFRKGHEQEKPVTLPVPPSTTSAQVGRFSTTAEVVSSIRAAATQTGARFDVLLASAALESGLSPNSQASGSSASGMFQFIEQTWLDAIHRYGPSHGLDTEAAAVVRNGGQWTVNDAALRQRILDQRSDPRISSLLAGDSLLEIADHLTPVLGRAPDAAETYLGHFLGSGGATKVLQAVRATPNRAAADLLPAAARANPTIFNGADGTPLSVTQLVEKVRGRVARAYADLGAAMPAGGIGVATRPATSTADAAEAGASGWGSSGPRRRVSPPERLMLSNLAEVVTRVDRGVAKAAASRQRRPSGLPAPLLQALQGGPSAT
jgi:hypothetical protein